MFYDVYSELCQEKGVSCSRAAKEIGLSNSTVTKWKNTGAVPSGDTLAKVAAYFVTDAQYEEVKQFVRFIKERDANGNKG